jgi:hypothetical protein
MGHFPLELAAKASDQALDSMKRMSPGETAAITRRIREVGASKRAAGTGTKTGTKGVGKCWRQQGMVENCWLDSQVRT